MIESKGLRFEEHRILTEDGYVISAWRVFRGGKVKRKPVLIQHGLLDSSVTWLTPTWSNNIVRMLTDTGFEVWLGNNRGNKYSHGHSYLDARTDDQY